MRAATHNPLRAPPILFGAVPFAFALLRALTTGTMPRHPWKGLHLLFGILGLMAFLFTGQFMDRRLDHLAGMPDGPRALYRSGHIYILFSALLNLLLGVYVVSSRDRVVRILPLLGSTLVLSALVLFVYGFFVETPLATIERPMTREAIVWSLAGVLLHATAGLRGGVRENATRVSG